MDADRKALLQLHTALILSALTALFAKLIHLPVNQTICGRAAVAAGALWLFLRFTGQRIRLDSRREYLFFFGTGVLLAGHWLTYFQSIRLSTVAIGILSLYTYPVITIILEPFFDRTRHRAVDFAVGAFVFLGVALMIPEFDFSNDFTRGIAWGVLSAFIYALRNIISRRHVRKRPAPTVMFHQTLATAIVLLPTCFVNADEFSTTEIWRLVLLGVVFTAVHHTLFAAVFKVFKAKTVSILSTVQPIYGVVFAMIVLGEVPAIRTVIGGLIVIAASIYETKFAKR